MSIGGAHACAVVDGGLRCWGRNNYNQIGRASQASVLDQPATVIARGVSAVSAGENHTCAIVDGGLFCWGYNYHGQIGNGISGEPVPEPVQVFAGGVTAVSAGGDYTCAVVGDGLHCWGKNEDALGLGERNIHSPPHVTQPARVLRGAIGAVAADSGSRYSQHTCAIVDAALYCWGDNDLGQIGHGPPQGRVPTPVKVLERGVTAVAVSNGRTCAVVNGTEQCWRYGADGAIVPRLPTMVMARPGPAKAGVSRYSGAFTGHVCNFGMALTRLSVDAQGKLAGEYIRLSREDSATSDMRGTLDDCKLLPDDAVQCTWHDEYGEHGTGGMIIQFDEDATEFRGNYGWEADSAKPLGPRRLKRDDWLREVSCWRGVRQ